MDHAGTTLRNRFGTFGGVFTPSILTVFGLIMFMRANQVIGTAGILPSLLILTLSSGITLLTGLSISAISSNTPVKGGGAYFLISRVLGPAFGTAIGIALFLAQAVSVPFYIMGFVEALVQTFPPLAPAYLWICLAVLALLFALTWSGANWVIRVQYGILATLAAAIVTFLVGAWTQFDPQVFRANLHAEYSGGESFWRMFALYFPAVTGIMAGVNMSGDLRNPARSIPLGTLMAVVVGFVVYGLQILICGGMADRAELIARPYTLLVENAFLGLGWLVTAGVLLATLSSAIGSDLGAPRVLQAVGRDHLLPVLSVFGKGTSKGDEPRQALILTFGLGVCVLVGFGRGNSGKGLNMVASVVTMIFLYTYGMTNLAAFVERFGLNPSFRPRFRFLHWTTAAAGAAACLLTAFMISASAALLAMAFLGLVYLLVRKREMAEAFGDARRGFVYTSLARNLQRLAQMPLHPKNWRPTILVLSGNPHQRSALVTCARWLGQRNGIVSVMNILVRTEGDLREDRGKALTQLQEFCRTQAPGVFPEAIVVDDFDRDLNVILQSYAMGPLRPNVVLLGWPQNRARLPHYLHHLQTVCDLGHSLVIYMHRTQRESQAGNGTVDIWWRGFGNGSLMVILGHMLLLNPEWRLARLRILRLVGSREEAAAAEAEITEMLHQARVEAEVAIAVSQASFASVLREHSRDARMILLGFRQFSESFGGPFLDQTEALLDGMPPTLLVHSSGEADLLA
jgi:amino acid transporter